MSRISLTKRLAAIRTAMQSHDDYGYRLYHLSPRLRAWHDDWKAECHRLAARYDNYYQAMIEGDVDMPPMPNPVAQALGLDKSRHILPANCTLDDAADAYTRLLDERT